MSTKDIKSKSIDNAVQKFNVESKTWKNDMRMAVNLGYKVEPLNEEQTEYLKKVEAKKIEKETKAHMKQEAHVTLLAKASEMIKLKKEQILQVANAFADRVILKAIAKEEQEKKFSETKKKTKEKVKKDRMKLAEAKRKRKAEVRNKTIPSLEAIAKAKKQQDFLSKAHAVKREEIEKRLDEKKNCMTEKVEVTAARRILVKERLQKRLLARLHMLTGREPLGFTGKKANRKRPTDRTTKEQRIEAAKAQKEAGKVAYIAEMKRQASEIAADRSGYASRQEKRKNKEIERLTKLAERRKDRIDRIFAEKLKQQKVSQANLNRFLESEKARIARKEAKQAKYITKGRIKVPKVKISVPADTTRSQEYIKQAEKNMKEDKVRYIIRIASIETSKIVSDSVGAFTCKPNELSKRMKEAHNSNMKEAPDTYIGVYAYFGVGKDMRCISEMINDKFLEFNGESMSRVNIQDTVAA